MLLRNGSIQGAKPVILTGVSSACIKVCSPDKFTFSTLLMTPEDVLVG